MKNTKILLTVILCGLFALAGCGAADTTGNTSAGKKEEPAKSVLKPADVSADKAVSVADLTASVNTEKDSWMNKEILAEGYVMGTSGSGGKFGYSLTLKNDQKASSSENLISCKVPEGDLPKGMLSKTIKVKGKIKEITDKGIMVRLDPCEVVE